MIWSGFLIYWANDVYRIGIGDVTLFHFFPDPVYKALHINNRLAEGMAWHFAFMWLFGINGVAYVIYTALSGEWRYLVPNANVVPGGYSGNTLRLAFEQSEAAGQEV